MHGVAEGGGSRNATLVLSTRLYTWMAIHEWQFGTVCTFRMSMFHQYHSFLVLPVENFPNPNIFFFPLWKISPVSRLSWSFCGGFPILVLPSFYFEGFSQHHCIYSIIPLESKGLIENMFCTNTSETTGPDTAWMCMCKISLYFTFQVEMRMIQHLII